VVQDLLRATDDHDVGPAVAHFLNCIMGDVQPTSTKGGSAQSKSLKKVMGIVYIANILVLKWSDSVLDHSYILVCWLSFVFRIYYLSTSC
jgi:hypothetical protein